jgi:acyl-CoA-dependent ceramide synthase
MKTYYLLEFAYWCQQFLLIALRVEKPRKDFTELVLHHVVTLWLIGGSYVINLVYVGNAVFITMDWSDVFLSVRCKTRTSLLSTDWT